MRRSTIAIVAVVGTLALPALSLAHLERPSYWPDPGPDTSVSPPAGGEAPKARSLASAVTGAGPGQVRVVCQGEDGSASLRKLADRLRHARNKGFSIRPSIDEHKLPRGEARKLTRKNEALAKKCRYDTIQEAIDDSGNNDRVVIMPGRYREPESRKAPLEDPKCADLTQLDSSGAETPSYAYQVKCPHDQNLIYVQGRAVGDAPPQPPLEDRHGIPDEARCLRCNLQIEGSGLIPEDVILDAGKRYSSGSAAARPGAFGKHVVLRVDRADGFVGRNFLMRGGLEFGFYTEETDGILLDRTKFFWNADYGHLSFTTDHNVVKNCEAIGAGDAGVYPGAAPETGAQAVLDFYPDAPRINTVIKKCDLHANVLAYSGSMGNAVRITRNHIYGNNAGIVTDTISTSGHPGFPADGVEVDHNRIYSNNLNIFATDDPPIPPVVGVLPMGVGVLWAGHNDGAVHDNWIFDNWRYGTQQLAIPDAVVRQFVDYEPEGGVDPGISCQTEPDISTSCHNYYFDNQMGVAPPKFKAPKAVRAFGNLVGGRSGVLPNGLDFWWDEYATNVGNCWFDNTGPDGTEASVTGPGPGDTPHILPTKPGCDSYEGTGDAAKFLNSFTCFAAREIGGPGEGCDWFTVPPRPGTPAAARYLRERERVARRNLRSSEGERMQAYIDEQLERAGTD
jgi:hypothetical protein